MKRSFSTLNENNNNNYNNNNSKKNIKKPENENLYSCNLQQNDNGMMSSENLITKIDNNVIDNYIDDLEIWFSKNIEDNNSTKKIYTVGNIKQIAVGDKIDLNRNYSFFVTDNIELIKNFFYNKN